MKTNAYIYMQVALVYDHAFWEGPEHRDIYGLLNEANKFESLDQKDYRERRGRFYLLWNCIPTTGRPVLMALMAGEAAHSAESTSDESLVREVTGRLAKMFPHATIPQPIETIVTRWKRDPFARGSYSYVGPQTQSGDYDVMARPVGPLLFAGEATCGTHPATVHGAYLSGLRAAADVINDFLGPVEAPEKISTGKIQPDLPLVDVPVKKVKIKPSVAWELVPVQPLPTPPPTIFTSRDKEEIEQYEASIIGAILSEVGERPLKPTVAGVNPFLLYQKDHWYNCKAECEALKQQNTGKPDAKASREEIRIHLGQKWRNLSEEVKAPYQTLAQASRDQTGERTADYKDRVAKWDADAVRIREEYVKNNAPPEASRGKFSSASYKTPIELGAARKGRKVNYAEEDEGMAGT